MEHSDHDTVRSRPVASGLGRPRVVRVVKHAKPGPHGTDLVRPTLATRLRGWLARRVGRKIARSESANIYPLF